MEDVVVRARLVGPIGHVERPSKPCLDLGVMILYEEHLNNAEIT